MARLTPPSAAAHAVHASARLPGGQCGTAYDGVVEVPNGLRVVRVDVDAAIGLQPKAGQPARLVGVPRHAGSSTVTVHCIDARGAAQVLQAPLHVSASAQSLWKVLPSDQSDALAKTDADSVLLDAMGARLLGGSVRGRAHAQKGGFREDDFRIAALPGGHVALIVSDGAGSADLAREGSRIAVSAALEALQLSFAARAAHSSGAGVDTRGVDTSRSASDVMDASAATSLLALSDADYVRELRDAAEHACTALEARAAELQRPLADLHATLLIAVARLAAPFTVAALQIGDGMIAVQCSADVDVASNAHDKAHDATWADMQHLDPSDARWSGPLCEGDHGEYAGQTRFLTPAAFNDAFDARIRVRHFARGGRLLVCSDGIVDPFFETEQAFVAPECWHPFVAGLDTTVGAVDGGAPDTGGVDVRAALLDWLQAFTPGHHDDRTLVLLDRLPVQRAAAGDAR